MFPSIKLFPPKLLKASSMHDSVVQPVNKSVYITRCNKRSNRNRGKIWPTKVEDFIFMFYCAKRLVNIT